MVHKRKGRDLLFFFSRAQPVSLHTEAFQVCYVIHDSYVYIQGTPAAKEISFPVRFSFFLPLSSPYGPAVSLLEQ